MSRFEQGVLIIGEAVSIYMPNHFIWISGCWGNGVLTGIGICSPGDIRAVIRELADEECSSKDLAE